MPGTIQHDRTSHHGDFFLNELSSVDCARIICRQQPVRTADDYPAEFPAIGSMIPATTPPGWAVANQYRSNIAELTQGILNASDGASTLQIVDGGLSNISTSRRPDERSPPSPRLSTFTGNRGMLNIEYQTLIGEINREVSNIGLSSTNASNASNLTIYIGGGQGCD